VRLGRGDYFGERALLNRAPRAATVVAVEPGRVFSLQQADFESLLEHDLATRERLARAVAYRDEVAAMPLCRDLAPAELDLLLVRLQPRSAQPREVIIRQGDVGHRFYIVRSGHVEVVRDGSSLAQLGPGEAFGEIALLLDIPRTATVTALGATELLSLDAEAFRDLLASYLGRGEELSRLSHLRLSTHHLGVGQ
jgi:cGMP-dependent protein kinase